MNQDPVQKKGSCSRPSLSHKNSDEAHNPPKFVWSAIFNKEKEIKPIHAHRAQPFHMPPTYGPNKGINQNQSSSMHAQAAFLIPFLPQN